MKPPSDREEEENFSAVDEYGHRRTKQRKVDAALPGRLVLTVPFEVAERKQSTGSRS